MQHDFLQEEEDRVSSPPLSAVMSDVDATSDSASDNEDESMSPTQIPSNADETEDYKAQVQRLYREQVGHNWDKTAARNESCFALPSWLKDRVVPLLEDERDYICAEMFINMAMVVLPLMALFLRYPSHLAGLAFLVFRIPTFAPRFMLTLHVTSHRRLFKREHWLLNALPETLLAFTLGLPPGFYYIHHVMMHHVENNVFPSDISSTMPHQRDSWLELGHYIRKYYTHAVFYLPYYALKKKRYGLFAFHAVCWLSYFLGGLALLRTEHATAVIWLVLVPFVVLGVALMQGNYSQHIFVCPEDSFSNYRLAFNYIKHSDNQLTYNDGYHIVHHAHSRLHHTEMPQYFEDNIDRFAANDAFVFQEIDNQGVFWHVMKGRYAELYKHWVQLRPGPKRSVEEFERLCRYRLQPIHKQKPAPEQHSKAE